jgi:hypothetical protein
MTDGPLVRLFWRALDRLDYWLTQARLWLAGLPGVSEGRSRTRWVAYKLRSYPRRGGNAVKSGRPRDNFSIRFSFATFLGAAG